MDSEYFLSISDVSKQMSIPAHTLRYWERQFPAAVKPTTGAGGRRYYRAETVKVLGVIKNLLYDRGMTIAGVKKLIKEGNLPDNAETVPGIGASAPRRVAEAAAKPAPPLGAPALFSQKTDIDQAVDLLRRALAALQ
jgi:DNA-binding transcriptional MerR regulator